MNLNDLAKQVSTSYYSMFNTDRGGMVRFYRDDSRLIYDGQEFEGAQNIAAKLASSPLQKHEYLVGTFDCQPSGHPDGYFVYVTGDLTVTDDPTVAGAGKQHRSKFCQTFQLKRKQPEGYYYVLNDIFRSNCP